MISTTIVQAAKMELQRLDIQNNDSLKDLFFLLDYKDYEVRFETLKFLRKKLSIQKRYFIL